MKTTDEDLISSSACRITSFSVRPEDKDAIKEIELLKLHSTKTGVKLSYFIIQAIKKLNKELGLHADNSKN